MNLKKLLLFIIACVLSNTHYFSIHSFGQSTQTMPSFSHVETGSISVFCAFKDSDGILWFGTSQGLYTSAQIFSPFSQSQFRREELSNNINSIQQDNLGRLWLKTQANHYMIYSPKTDSLIYDVEKYLQDMDVKIWYDFRAKADNKGRMWFFKDNELFVTDFRTGSTRKKVMPEVAGRIIEVFFDDNTIYVFTEKEVYVQPSDDHQLHLRRLCATPSVLDYYASSYFNHDENGDMWLSNGTGFWCYDKGNGKWTSVQDVLPYVVSLIRMPDGKLYVGTTNAGVYVFKGRNLTERIYQTAPVVDGLLNNHLQCLFYDRSNNELAIAYHKHDLSIYRYALQDLSVHHVQYASNSYSVEDVICFAHAGNGELWMGTEDNGIYRVNKDVPDRILDNMFPGTTVTSILHDSKDRIWAGVYQKGLACSDGRLFFKGLSPYNIIEVSPTRFIVNINGAGLFDFNPDTGESNRIPTDNPWIMDIEEHKGYIYGASPTYLYKINTRTLSIDTISRDKFKGGYFSNGNKALMADHRGWIWLVNYKGRTPVDIYDSNTGRTMVVSELDEYIVYSLAEDERGDVWCATDKGMVRVTVVAGKAPKFKLHCFSNISSALYNERAIMSLKDGKIVTGLVNGFQIFSGKNLDGLVGMNSSDSRLILSTLRINDNYVRQGVEMNGRPIMDCDVTYLKEINLRYNENNITIGCGEKTFRPAGPLQYYYKLMGLNEEWLPMDNYTITLSNLPSGKYTLLIRNNMDSNGKEQELLTINIAPPLWRSAWAMIVYLIVVAAAGFLLFKYYRNRYRYQMEMKDMEAKAKRDREVNDMKLRFFTNISHDLRTPLTLILSPIEELLNKETDADRRGVLSIVYSNAKRLFDLVNQLLDFRKLEVTEVGFSPTYGDVVPLVRDIVDSFQLFAAEQGIRLVLDLREDALNMVFDKDKFRKIIENILSNAFKYSEKGGEVNVKLSHSEGHLVISVSDTGLGISDEDKHHIFDRFYVAGHNRQSGNSSGIGLHIVKEYTIMHQGDISVTDNIPHGSIFTLTIPVVVEGVALERKDGSQSVDALPVLPVENKGNTLLIVEDNIDLIRYMALMLSVEYKIVQATDGNQALQVLANTHVDVIVSDVMMDGMDGFELCKRVKNDIKLSHIPLIMLTAKALSSDEMKGLQLGASDYITKPFNLTILRLRIRSVLDRVSKARERFTAEADKIEPSEVTVTTLDEKLIADAIKIVEDNMGNPDFNVDVMSDMLCMHRTNLYKKLQFITGKTPAQFIRMMRVKRGRQLLSKGNVLVSQIAYQVGFNDPKKFARYFKDEFGMYPSEYVKQSGDNKGDATVPLP